MRIRARGTARRVHATARHRPPGAGHRCGRVPRDPGPAQLLGIKVPAMSGSFRVYRMPQQTEPSPRRVLVADDQPDVLEALRWLLSGEGYEPQFVSSTDGVLEKLRAERFD